MFRLILNLQLNQSCQQVDVIFNLYLVFSLAEPVASAPKYNMAKHFASNSQHEL